MPGRRRVTFTLVGLAAIGAVLATAVPLLITESTGSSTFVQRGACQRPIQRDPQCETPTRSGTTDAPSPSTSPSPTRSPSRSPSPRQSRARAPSGRSDGTAAGRYGWTNLVARDDFTGSSLDPSWGVYDSAGNDGKGIRSPGQISISNGVLRMTGTPNGRTAGMYWKGSQKYGRWEIRARFPAGCGCYHPVLILWPADGNWPAAGEIDYAEVFDPNRQKLNFFLHYSADNKVLDGSRQVDMTQWHNFAVEWTDDHLTGYVDGQPFFHTTQRNALPPGPMYQTIQLDWFPGDTPGGAILEVDWARKYKI